MKPDGVTMETMEPTEAAAGAEPSLSQGAAMQEEVTEQAQSASQPEKAACTTVPPAAQEANDKPAAADSKAKPQAVAPKVKLAAKTAGDSGSKSRPGSAPNRTVNGVKPTNSVPPRTTAAKKTTTTTAGASASGAVPKRPVGVSMASSTVRTQTKVPEKKPVGPVRATSAAAAVTNGTKPTTANGTPKRPATGPVNGARLKTTAPASRPAASTATKPSNSTAARPDRTAVSKTTRPATSTTSRFASTTSRPTTAGTAAATTKPPTTGTAKAAAARVTTAPSAGRTTAVQPPKNNAVAKKDVSRPASATAAKKPTTATTSAASKKPEPSKTTATLKPDAASKRPVPTKVADPKMSRPKTQEPPKPTPTKKAAPPAARLTALNKPPLGRNPPASPANKPATSSTAQTKRGPKPTQAVQPFTATKKTGAPNSATAAEGPSAAAIATTATAVVAATTAVAAAAAILAEQTEVPTETQAEAVLVSPEAPLHPAEEAPSPALAQDTPAEMVLQEAVQGDVTAPSPPQSPVRTAVPPTCPDQDLVESTTPALPAQEQISAPTEAALPTMPSPPELSEDHVLLAPDQIPSTSKAPPLTVSATLQVVSSSNLNEDDDEEEREGSQQVSVSEMSGTTQPTEESRPGSAGPLGGSAWRVGGALLSELDSEEVSGSQQGASELSAPGVLEGTESMDDLGDASLKGAIDMEGASAGSPDFEKVPDIPVNDFEEDEDDDEDDEDRVCDMDVGSERADDLQRPRHDNEVDDEEEDEDVEMASEGVTESGLESYGNADEDDFAEDERLDNLNRVAQPPPPPPLLPSAPAAQWDQPNPFADPWAQPIQLLQPQPPFEHISQPLQAAAASPSTDPWQADSETPTQSPAQAWLELGSAAYIPQNQDVSHHSSGQAEPQRPEAQTYMDQSNSTPMQTLAPAPLSAPGMSLSSTLSSETSTPEELCEYNREGKLQLSSQGSQAPMLSLQPDPEDQDLGIHLERGDREGEEEGEAETLPADEVLGGPATAPTSNPSSSSTTEDEASDTEGEAQLDDPLDGQGINNITFDGQPSTQRCLSAVDEGEEEGGVGGDATPPSANSAASYGFDTMTTASNSNAQSTGESCTKSPGIFSLEELPEEAKEPCIIMEPPAQPCPTEQHYMQCGKQEADTAEDVGVELSGSEEASAPSLLHLQQPEGDPDDSQPPYYSAICEKTENSFAGFSALPHSHRRDHSAYLRPYCDIVIPTGGAVTPPRLSCADLPPRNPGQQALSPQLRRLEQHQRQLLELQQRRGLQGRPTEVVEQERKTKEEEEQRKKREQAEEEIKKNKEAEEKKKQELEEAMKKEEELKQKEEMEKQRRDLQLQLQQQQQELKQRQQIMQWQQELEQQQQQQQQQQQSHKGQSTVLLSPSSGLCTIYEALENSDDEEAEEDEMKELNPAKEQKETSEETVNQEKDDHHVKVKSDEDKHQCSSPPTETPPPLPDSPQSPTGPQHPDVNNPPQDVDKSSPPPESPERPPPLDLDWGKKVDIVQQLINQTLLLTGDGCSSLLLLPGGGGGTLSPLESSLWPSMLPPLTPPSATVTSVSSFSPEAPGSSPQGEWTVVELETHH